MKKIIVNTLFFFAGIALIVFAILVYVRGAGNNGGVLTGMIISWVAFMFLDSAKRGLDE